MGSALTTRRLLDAAAHELGVDASKLADRDLALSLLAAFQVRLDGPTSYFDPRPLRTASTSHLLDRARLFADTAPRDEASDYPVLKTSWPKRRDWSAS